MTKEQLAALLNGREYGSEITREEEAHAKAAGLLVLMGASDDILSLRGVHSDEAGAYEGAKVRLRRDGSLLPNFASLDRDDEAGMRAYFRAEAEGWVEVEAEWSPDSIPDASWLIKTEVPHVTFDIMEDGEVFCRGVVLSIADLAAAPLRMVAA